MTEYLNQFEISRTPETFYKSAFKYILEEFLTNPDLKDVPELKDIVVGNGANLFQKMFDKSAIKMRMYGSAEELAENVEIYMNFPGGHQYFGTEHEPYAMTPTIYRSLKNEQFICKLDLFAVLQNMVVCCYSTGITDFSISMLRTHEKRLNGQAEFVRFDQKVLDEIWIEIHNAREAINTMIASGQDAEFEGLKKRIGSATHDEMYDELKRTVPNDWDEEYAKNIRLLLYGILLGTTGKEQAHVAFSKAIVFTMAKVSIETLQKVIDKRPELFRLHSETRKGPITVRMFEDGKKKFVMKMEFFNALKESSNGKIHYIPEEETFDTMKMEDVLRQYGDQIKGIEFIRYPIKRAKHRAVPVNGPNPANLNNFGILAVDALFETLRSMIMENQGFQEHIRECDWNSLAESFDHFFKQTESPYFFACFVVDIIRNVMKEGMERVNSIPVKNIRDAKPDGFTVQDLKNELAHLNLLFLFPEIQNHAEVVYEHVDRVKKERFLRTCDLIDAIEQCQLICIFERLPNLKKFLHSQGGCGRVIGLKCQLCMNHQKTSNDQKQLKLKETNPSLSCTSATVSLHDHSEVENLKNELKKEKEKTERLEQQVLKLNTENEKLMDKLSIGSSSKSSITVVEKPITCIICQGEIEEEMTIDCPMCGTKFHKKCALQYGQHQKKCPACKGEIVKFIC